MRDAARRGLERAASAVVRAWSRARLPRDRALRVPGLSLEALVRFDRRGVPHVRAATEADAFRALGVCHGRDRYFQMDMTRRVLSGRLAELVGERALGGRDVPPLSGGTTVDADRLFRVLDLVPAARTTLEAASPEERALLDAYVAGVNAAVARLRRRPPPEWRLLRLRVEDWTALDSCLVAKGMALGLSFKWRTGPVYAAVAQALADRPDHLRAILPRGPGAGAPTIACVAPGRGLGDALAFVGWEARLSGSNAFVVGAGRSASGAPLLANDPHLELSLPGVWYLASVSGGGYEAVGATLPGLPGVVIGRTPTVAWGFTNGMVDDADLWQEEVDGTGTRYRLDGAWRPMEVETQEVRRRGAAPVLLRLRRTHRGPVLSDAFPGYEGPPLSIRTLYRETTRDLPTFLALGRARTAADVERAAGGYGSPAQNLVYATTEGVAGYRLMGRLVRRPAGGDPALPLDGTTSASDWLGEVPSADLPAFRLGPADVCVTANDPQVGPDYPHYVSNLYEPGYRAERLRALLEGRDALSPGDLAAAQTDATSLQAAAFRRAVLLPNAQAVRAARPGAAAALDALLAWDGREDADSSAAALFHLVYYHLARRAFSPALGDALFHRWAGLVNLMDGPLLAAFSEDDDPWVRPAVRPTLLGEALEDAVRDLAARGHPPDVAWGRLHRLTLRHPLSAAPILGAAWTRGPYPMGGGPFTPLSGQYLHHKPVEMVVGASYRQVVDLSDPEGRSWMTTFGGQSGHVGSRHYDDLTGPWAQGRFLPMRLERLPPVGLDLRLLPA